MTNSFPTDLYCRIDIPEAPAGPIVIPVTQSCDVSFTLNQIATAEDDDSFSLPVDFLADDTVYLSIEINRTTTLTLDVTLDGNAASP
jgi:hypothetical protein